MSQTPLLLGLHITKCAGSSLATTMRRLLTEDQYYIYSSYKGNLEAGRPVALQFSPLTRLHFCFGHFFHEYLLRCFEDRSVVLFTGLRDPVDRLLSHFHQENSVRAEHGVPLLTADAFLVDGSNGICSELLRAFPTISEQHGEEWRKAFDALKLFDYIYDNETFDENAAELLARLNLAVDSMTRDNDARDKQLSLRDREFIERESGDLKGRAGEVLMNDQKLYDLVRTTLKMKGSQSLTDPDERAKLRADLLARLPNPAKSLQEFSIWEAKHLSYEYKMLGRTSELASWIEKTSSHWKTVSELIR